MHTWLFGNLVMTVSEKAIVGPEDLPFVSLLCEPLILHESNTDSKTKDIVMI